MAASRKTPPGRQTRPGEAAPGLPKNASGGTTKASTPKPGSSTPKGYTGPAGASPGRKPTVGAKTEDKTSKKVRKHNAAQAKAAQPAKPPAAVPTPPDPPPTDPPQATGPDPARLKMESYLRMAGFPVSLVDTFLKPGVLPDNPQVEDFIAVAVDVPEFKARYPAIVNRWKRIQAGEVGLEIITPSQVIEYEKTLKNAADDFGLSSWVTTPEQIATLIDNDVDVNEAVDRINQAGYAAVAAPKEFREAFFKKFGLTEGNLVGYFLDPDKEEGEIRKSVAQGKVVAAAMQNGFSNNWNIGQRLIDRGVNEDSTMSGFASAALNRGLGSGLGDTITEDQMIDSEFGDAAAKNRVASVAAQRVGRFSGAGGANESQTGVTGLSTARTT